MARDPTRRFSGRVADYVRSRPRYPAGVLDILRTEIGLEQSWRVADIGSGTGLSAELFLGNGNEVFAVEPNPDMRATAEEIHDGDAHFHSIDGTAEDTGLPPASVDLVVAAQAFHWFDPDRARTHFVEILRPPRWTVLLWNKRRTDASAFLRAYEDLLSTYGTDYKRVRHDQIPAGALHHFFGGPYGLHILPNGQTFDYPGLESRLLSSSYTPGPQDPGRTPMLEALRAMFDEHAVDGRVAFEYETEVYVGGLR